MYKILIQQTYELKKAIFGVDSSTKEILQKVLCHNTIRNILIHSQMQAFIIQHLIMMTFGQKSADARARG